MSDLIVRFAQTDDDVIAIHQFLCVMAGPTLPGVIEPKISIEEVWRVTNHECALLAVRGDRLVGTLGIVRQKYWWGKAYFLANRWYFALPGHGAGTLLRKEGEAIAEASGLELWIISEAKGKLVILNRDPRRDAAAPDLTGMLGPVVGRTSGQRPSLQ